MRILGIGEDHSLADMYLRLQAQGHSVKAYVEESAAQDVLSGMVERVDEWRDELDWVSAAGAEGLIVFETASMGLLQDRLRGDGFHVVGGSAFGDQLEGDRAFAQQCLNDCGVPTAFYRGFTDFSAARRFVEDRPSRYVYKINDASVAATSNYVGEAPDGADIAALLELHAAQWERDEPPDFILMEHLQGVEVGVGAYFNGMRFLEPVCLDWEHKRFFPGDLGELTGEMGTVVTYRRAQRIFERTLARIAPRLRASDYRGYINLNTIVNERGIWPLEFTCRFGYPGFSICSALHRTQWDSILYSIAHGIEDSFETDDGFAVGVVLTVPPFPYPFGYEALSKGAPVLFREPLSTQDRDHFHFSEVARRGDQLVASGATGYLMTVTGTGPSVPEAQRAAYAVAKRVVVPNLRYRIDIGDKLIREDLTLLEQWGYLG